MAARDRRAEVQLRRGAREADRGRRQRARGEPAARLRRRVGERDDDPVARRGEELRLDRIAPPHPPLAAPDRAARPRPSRDARAVRQGARQARRVSPMARPRVRTHRRDRDRSRDGRSARGPGQHRGCELLLAVDPGGACPPSRSPRASARVDCRSASRWSAATARTSTRSRSPPGSNRRSLSSPGLPAAERRRVASSR